jgi:hypothetical protein
MTASLFVNPARAGRLRQCLLLAGICVAVAVAPVPALANNYGESLAWQFKTSADRANQAAVLDMIEKRAAAIMRPRSTPRTSRASIIARSRRRDRQQQRSQAAVANSPTVTGATSTATGNSSATMTGDGRMPAP